MNDPFYGFYREYGLPGILHKVVDCPSGSGLEAATYWMFIGGFADLLDPGTGF